MKDLAARVLNLAKAKGVTIATVESCTGGMVSAALTAIPGSSAVFERGWATYSNQAKHDEVGVSMDLLTAYGAVSEQVAIAMAEGALNTCPATLTVSITGIAGPDGGSAAKPVGLVHFACALRGQPTVHRNEIFAGSRDEVRAQAAFTALSMLESRLL